ncbi:hypothetical protein ZIOFF_061607 [Zingiber officinale]|uniref:Vesicle transport protein n=1 Tax=Zingiber officinale TaxID=94328 RepID=A0A8J5EZE7_ZINOF|nr:hypothetical protein ZIOFF_061607 [Zingiber officinale]
MMMETMNRALEKAKMLVGMEPDEESIAQETQSSSFFDDFDRNCTLSTKQRLYGFAICLSSGLACTIMVKPLPSKLSRPNHTSTLASNSLAFFLSIINACFFQPNQIWHNIHLWEFPCNWKVCAHTLKLRYDSTILMLHFLLSVFLKSNPLSFGSTAFLIGPKRQIDMMLDPVRIYATSIYIASMIIALFSAFYVHNKLLTLLAIILEFGALIWYSLSYIPFARSAVSKVMVSCFDAEF